MKKLLKLGSLALLLVAVSFVYKLFGGETNLINKTFADAVGGVGGTANDDSACGNGEDADAGSDAGSDGSDGSDGSST